MILSLALPGAPRAQHPPEVGPPVSWAPPLEVAAGEAVRGPWQQNGSRYAWVDDPAVAVAPDGGAVVAWVDQERKDVYLQRYDAEGRPRLDRPANVSRSAAVFSWLPRVVLLEGGRSVAVLWQEIVFSGGSHGGDILFARSTDGGRTFTPPTNLSRSVAGDGKGRLDARTWDNGSLDLVPGGGDLLYAAWTEYEGALRVSRSADAGATFSAPVQVPDTGARRPARGPSLAAAGEAVLVAWAVGEDPGADIQVSASRDGGRTFDAPRPAARTAGRADAPRIALGRDGAVHLVFAEAARGGGGGGVLHARAAPGTLAFSPPRPVHAGAAPGEQAVYPDLAVAADGSIWIMSELLEPGADRPRGLQLSRSSDGGRTFSAAAAIPGSRAPPATNGGEQGRFMRRLAVGEAEVLVGLSTFQRGAASRILLLRGARG